MLSVRILTIDSYQTNPIPDLDPTFSEFRGNEIKRVPVIRIFGPTSTGEKTCLHIHGVFPYMYVPCTIKENINSFMHRLSSSIDNAINVSSGKSACRTQHVYKIQLVRGIPIYGYHEREHLFFKIYFYTPSIIKKVADLLQNGSISNLKLQPHEAHIPFILQFMMDYNLYGMNFINIKKMKHRWHTLSTTKEETNQMNNIESYDSQKYLPMSVDRQTICALEVDAQANDILNRRAIDKVIELNPGLAEIWKQEKTRRLQAGLEDVNSQLLYPKSPEKRIVVPTVNDNNQEQRILQKLQDILQERENTTLSDSTVEISYPLQAQEDDNSLNASCVVNHITPFSSQKINEKEQIKSDNLKDLSSYFLLESLSTENNSHNTSSLNEDDMNLVEMLADLSESDDVKRIVDDDSILGSQYSEQDNKVLYDCEEDESEQLNLTNLDLTILSQNQPDNTIEKLQKSNEENMQTDRDNNLSKFNFPQFDGANDFVASPKSKKKRKTNTQSNKIGSSSQKCKKKKTENAEQACVDEPNLEIASSSTLSNKNHPISTTIDPDIIILDEIETRSCTYDRHKSSIKQSVIDIEQEEKTDDLKTHKCDRLTKYKSMDDEDLQKKMHKSKINKQGLLKKSPNSPRNYSPLNVIISSPKTLRSSNKNVINSNIPKQDCKILPRKLVFSESDDLKCNITKPNVSQCNLDRKSLSTDDQPKKSDITYKNDKTTYSNFPNDVSFQIKELNVSEGDAEENIHNVTFTQYIEEKMKNETQIFQSSYTVSKDNQTKRVPITIITKFNPPSRERILQSLVTCDISKRTRTEPFFSNKLDLMKQKEMSSNAFNIPVIKSFNSSLEGITGIKLWRRMKVNEFYPAGSNIKSNHMKKVLAGYNLLTIRTLMEPPQLKSVKSWLKSKNCPPINNQLIDNNNTSTNGQSPSSSNSNSLKKNTLENTFNDTFKHKDKRESQYLGISHGQIEYSLHEKIGNASNENLQNSRILAMHQYITLLSVEVHIPTREDFLPNPQYDPIEAIFYAIHNDIPISSDVKQMEYGTIIIRSSDEQPINFINSHIPLIPTSIQYVENEVELLNHLVTLIRRCDPDILIGWEVEVSSWGYIFQRASHLGFKPFPLYISRTPNISSNYGFQMFSEDSEIKVPGRIFLNIWRIMRHEVALSSYTFESIMYNVMKERVSCHNYKTLTNWWKSSNIAMKSRVIDYYIIRVSGNLRILSQLDIIGRTSEHARLFGIQFYEVFSRGSQFRVESMMLRLAKPLNFIPVSPSIQQRAKMRAPAALPLIMEPESKFYTDPLVVLDFQSLYPSIIIAYNYCFSTCLGRVEHLGQSIPFVFGATTLKINKNTLLKLQGKMNFAPNGVAFVKSEVRKGVLPRMLAEILNTRIMVKNSMKLHSSDNHNLQRMLHSQQLGLKLIANVTYGYTSANFSGRMPCIEIGDSVVSKGRETLERAIKIVESTPKWGAKVVYGDTDSLFILLPGKSRQEAFKIGADMADTITAANPPPIKLKFEKILQPSILQTKKRYCGYMYETSDQKIPEYLAKGIETVRRDGCFAVSKILEKSLKILFDTSDISLIKKYLIRQFNKILCRRVSIEDLTFAKEFRGLDGYKTNAVVPALELTRRLMRKDPRAIPLTGERVRYVITAGAPNQALIHCVRTPWEVMCDPGLYPNSIYYITKVIIPPINRCFNLFGIDVNNWYQEMSHRQSFDKLDYLNTKNQKSTICQFFNTTECNICGEQSTNEICSECMAQPDKTILTIYEKIRWFERTYQQFNEICYSCVGRRDYPDCTSLDCPVLYRMHEARKNLAQVSYLNNLINNGINNVNIRDKNVPSS